MHDRISRDVELCCNGEPGLLPGREAGSSGPGIRVIVAEIVGIHAQPDGLTLSMGDSITRTYRAGFLSVRYRQRSPIARELGCAMRDDGRVLVDHFQRSSAPHVFAVGDMARPATGNMTFVATAIATA